MSKYYTPEIEEFHVGFEYEEFYDEKYIKCIYKDQKNKLELILNYLKPRVKYLDKKDIESLGFKGDLERTLVKNQRIYYKKCKLGFIELLFDTQIHDIKISIITESNRAVTIFIGSIKNKSELKKLLKQLNIK